MPAYTSDGKEIKIGDVLFHKEKGLTLVVDEYVYAVLTHTEIVNMGRLKSKKYVYPHLEKVECVECDSE